MTEIIVALLGGLVGAIIGVVAAIIYEEYKFKRNIKLDLAKEKLEKLYGPLMFLIKKSKLLDGKGEKILFSREEGKLLDKLVVNYSHLADDDLKEDVVLLHSHLRHNSGLGKRFDKLVPEIKRGYKRNRNILESGK